MRVRSLLSLGILLAVVGMSGNRDTEASRRNPDSVARPMRSMGPPSCPGMVPVVAVPEKSARDAELERPILAAVRALPRVVQAHAAVAMRTHDASSTAAHKAAVIAV